MMGRKPKRATSEYQKVTHIPRQNIKRKRITSHLINQIESRSLKNPAITKALSHEQTDKALQETEHFLSDVFAGIQDGISVLDKDMNIIRVNQTIEQWYSHAMPLIGKKCYEAYYGRKERCDICPSHQTILTGKGAYEVVPKPGPDGKTVGWLGVYSFPLIDTASGKIKGVIEYARDITERKQTEELLRESEAKFQQLFDEAPVGYHEYDTQGRITKVNHTELEMLGYTPEEVLGQPVWKFIGDEETSRQMVLAKIAGTVPPSHSFELVYRRKDGTTLAALIEDRPLRDSEGRIIGIRSTIQDITEQKRAEEAIRESEKRYRQVIENAVDIIYTTDANGNFTYANSAALTIVGYSLEELRRFNYLDLILPEHRDRVSKIYISQFRERQVTTYVEFPFLSKSGDVLWFGQNASLVIEGGRPVGFHVIARDITERMRAEEALRISEERYRTILENIEDGYYEVDLAGNFTFVNDSHCRIHGYPKEELMGMNTRQYTDKETAKRTYQVFNKIYRTGEPGRIFANEIIRKDGTKAITELSASLIRNPEGKPIGFRGIIRDVTERIQAEKAVARLSQENAVIAEIGRIIGSTLEIEEVYEQFAKEVHKLILFDAIAINMVNYEEGIVTVPFVSEISVAGCQPGEILPLAGSVTGKVMQTRSGLIIQTENRDEVKDQFPNLLTAFDKGLRSLMVVPLIYKDHVIGALHFRSVKSNAYSGKDLELAASIGNQIAGAIANAMLFIERKRAEEELRKSEEEAKRLSKENEIVAEIGRIVGSTLNIEEVYERFAEEVRKLIPSDRIVINTIDVENAIFKNVYMAGKGIKDRIVGKIYPLEGSGNAEMVHTKSSLLIQTKDFSEYKERFPMLLSTFEAGFQSILNVPLFSKGRIIGGLLLRSVKPYAYTDKDMRLAERVSNQIAGAIANAQLFVDRKQAEEALRRSEERYRTILEEMEEGYFETDLAGKLTFLNDAGCRNLGYPREELIGKDNRNYANEENRKKAFQTFTKVYKTGQLCKIFDYELTRKDGAKVIIELSVSLMRNSDGKPIGFRGISHHVTERKQMEEALRQSEERYRTILENIEEAYFEDDLAGNFTFVNDVLCKHLGYTRQELIGMNYGQHMNKEDAKKLHELYNHVYRTGEMIKTFDLEAIKKDGTKAIYETSVSLMKDSEGKPIGFRGVSRDITERKRAEEALRERGEKYRTLLETMEEGYYEVDLKGRFTFFNEALRKMHALSKEEMLGLSNRQYMSEATANKVYKIFNQVYKTGHPDKISEWEIIRGDSKKAIVESSVYLITNAKGEPVGFRGITRDITERKRIEEALRQSEERYRNNLESIQEGYFEIDLNGNYTFVNDANCRFLGYTREELIGMNYQQHTEEEVVKKLYPLYRELYETGKPIESLEFEAIRKDGAKVIYETSVTLMRDSRGKPIGIRGVSRDITERKRSEEALSKSEEKYRTILETMWDGYWETDLEGNFTFVNDAQCRMSGSTRERLIGRNNRQYTTEEEAKKIYQAFNRVYRTGEPVKSYQFEFIKRDGIKTNNEISISLIRDAEGKPIGFRGVSRDITESKRAEEALRQSEEKYRNILENIEDGYYEVDFSGNFTFLNDSMCRIWGYPRKELMGLNYKQYTDEETGKKLFQIFNEMYKTGNPCKEYNYELIRKDGVKRYIEATASLKRDSSGKPIGFRGVVRDVTERKQSEEALRNSEERYRTIIENIQDGYFESDLAGNFIFANYAIEKNLKYTRDELIGMNYRQYTDVENAKKLYQLYNELYRTGQPIKPFEAEYVRKDGGKQVVELSVSLIRDFEGKPIGFRGISRDITERKQAEEEKLFLQEQLRQSQKMEAVGQLAGGVAHDFNNLLTVIKGYSQLSLLDLKESDPLRSNIQEIEKATQRATDLTRQLLAFSRRQILDLKVLDLNVLLKDMEKMLRRIIGEDIELVTLLSKDLGKVKVDPSQIEQVIFNLAVNARDAMPTGGKLTIETANVELDEAYAHAHVGVVPGRYVRLSVSDTGVGMTQEVKEKIFEPFFTTKEKGKGTGLGLSTVYGIVKQSNGNIWVYSEPNRGTTFRIYFPRTEEEADTLHEQEETDSLPRGSETVLLVEDDELVRDLANRLLKQQGYTVLEASNGQDALRVAKECAGKTIHLLLADIVMPQMGGKELADWIKISRPNIKVLFTSGYADNAIVHHGVLDRGTHFLQKPFSLKTLSHKVREVLDG